MEIRVFFWKNGFVGPCSVPMDKALFYSSQLILKLVQRYQENDHIHGVTHTRAKLRFLPMPPFLEKKKKKVTQALLFVIGTILSKVFTSNWQKMLTYTETHMCIYIFLFRYCHKLIDWNETADMNPCSIL